MHVETLCALELVHQSDVLYCIVLQCYGSLHVLRYFADWNWRIAATCFTVACCNSIVFFKSVSAAHNGMAASRSFERYLVSSSKVLGLQLCLAIVLCLASHSWRIALELLHHGCDLNVKICTKHCFFG